jgi:hypothetical protein
MTNDKFIRHLSFLPSAGWWPALTAGARAAGRLGRAQRVATYDISALPRSGRAQLGTATKERVLGKRSAAVSAAASR